MTTHTKCTFQQLSKQVLIAMCLTIVSVSAIAQRDGDGDNKKHRGPPPEAIEACSGFNEGDVCQFTGRRGDASGVCVVPPKDDSVLACKPKDHKQRD